MVVHKIVKENGAQKMHFLLSIQIGVKLDGISATPIAPSSRHFGSEHANPCRINLCRTSLCHTGIKEVVSIVRRADSGVNFYL